MKLIPIKSKRGKFIIFVPGYNLYLQKKNYWSKSDRGCKNFKSLEEAQREIKKINNFHESFCRLPGHGYYYDT